MADAELTKDDFTYPIDASQIEKFIPKATTFKEVNSVLNMILVEDNLPCTWMNHSTPIRDRTRSNAALIVNAYNSADKHYAFIRQAGIIAWVLSHRASYATAVLLRAKHDGVKFDL